jgi:hypothetical protein
MLGIAAAQAPIPEPLARNTAVVAARAPIGYFISGVFVTIRFVQFAIRIA